MTSWLKLTVLAHPDASRLGQTAPWAPHVERIDLGRGAPFFGGAALQDRSVSRRGHALFREGGGVAVVGPQGRAHLDPAQLVQGVHVSCSEEVRVLLRAHVEPAGLLPSVLGLSPEFERLRREASFQRGQHLLLVGPEGSGRGHLARALHEEGPFVVVEGADLPTARLPAEGSVVVRLGKASRAAQKVLANAASGAAWRLRVIASHSDLEPTLAALLARVHTPELQVEDVALLLNHFYLRRCEALMRPPRPHDWVGSARALSWCTQRWPRHLRQLRSEVSAFVDLEQDVVTGVLEVPQHANDALARILAAIDERLDDPELSIGGLCRTLGMTERTLQRQLKEFTGRSPRAEVRERRLLRAKSLLTGGRFSSVAEVAAAVGMSPSTFSRTYRDWAGCSPRQDLR